MSGSYDKKSNYRCDYSELISVSNVGGQIDDNGDFSLDLTYNQECDKVRISIAYDIIYSPNIPNLHTLKIDTDLINKPIFCVGSDLNGRFVAAGVDNHGYFKDLVPNQGQEIIYYNKVIPAGEYRCKLKYLSGQNIVLSATQITSIILYFYVEYFKN
jgi:hypothetical protein